ncbi:hypothetical protein CVT24_000387 [Panaeolus cyanescens]|uniref:Uncharacterized protein n=1 Tax=Panaeolus cyanescens TaxID=181874 RepID=A0A409YD11_9AGAR|nr:hypothetical protein CVT24_000387 [Panaeolus cyanescens]
MSFEQRLSDARHNIDCFIESYDSQVPESAVGHEEFVEEFILDLEDLIRVIEEAHAAQYPALERLIEKADALLNRALNWACASENPPFDTGELRSYAHSHPDRPLLEDKDKACKSRPTSVLRDDSILNLLQMLLGVERELIRSFEARRNEFLATIPVPDAWPNTPHPHPLTTRCARFRSGIHNLSQHLGSESSQSLATSIFQARCEVSSGKTSAPWSSFMSEDGNLLAVSTMGGWKNRIPYMTCYFVDHSVTVDDEWSGFLNKRTVKLDLTTGPCQQLVVDSSQSLIITADYDRIKTYSYTLPQPQPQDASDDPAKPPPLKRVHTFNSKGYEGPVLLRPDGKFIRAARNGNVAVWNMVQVDTHGDDGKKIIGTAMVQDSIDTWRDDPEDIEPSTGNVPHLTFKLPPLPTFRGEPGDPFAIGHWHKHPSQDGTMLCGTPQNGKTFQCHAIDLNVEGKTVARYLGHGGTVQGFSTSPGDPNVFLTRCEDGKARIFDVRTPIPAMTILGTVEREALSAAVLVHADGVPFVFTGSQRGEVVKLWDIRARALIYELGTGNNAVTALNWDASRNALYATTTSEHSSGRGKYRQATIPRSSQQGSTSASAQTGNVVDYPPEDEEDANLDQYKRWPMNAYNDEGYFGYAWDAGSHRLYKYTFKADADPNRLPFYHGMC